MWYRVSFVVLEQVVSQYRGSHHAVFVLDAVLKFGTLLNMQSLQNGSQVGLNIGTKFN